MFIFGPGDQGALRWTRANVLGGCTGGLVGGYMITKLKGCYDERVHTSRRQPLQVGRAESFVRSVRNQRSSPEDVGVPERSSL